MARSIRSLLALIFIVLGVAFLSGTESTLGVFQQIGLGEWLRYVTGFSAVSGGMLLLIPSRAVVGSAIATTVSLGALLIQAFVTIGSPVLTVILAFLSGGSLIQAELAEPITTHRRQGHAA
jgi:putative oxidoreductase